MEGIALSIEVMKLAKAIYEAHKLEVENHKELQEIWRTIGRITPILERCKELTHLSSEYKKLLFEQTQIIQSQLTEFNIFLFSYFPAHANYFRGIQDKSTKIFFAKKHKKKIDKFNDKFNNAFNLINPILNASSSKMINEVLLQTRKIQDELKHRAVDELIDKVMCQIDISELSERHVKNLRLKLIRPSVDNAFNEQFEDNTESFVTQINDNDSRFNVSPFELLSFDQYLGRGTFGDVYRGRWANQRVAFKIMYASETSSLHLSSLYAHETKLMSHLDSPYVIKAYGGIKLKNKNAACIILEYMGRGSLKSQLSMKDSKIHELEFKIKIAKSIAKGLHYLHSQNVFHYDLNSDDILFNENWEMKISDFGLAKASFNSVNSGGNSFNKDHAIWLAPEQFQSNFQKIDYSKVDCYAYGLVLYHLFTEELPYKNLEINEENIRATKDSPLKYLSFLPVLEKIPKFFKEMIIQCVDPDPENRPKFSEIVAKIRLNGTDKYLHPSNENLTKAKNKLERVLELDKNNAEARLRLFKLSKFPFLFSSHDSLIGHAEELIKSGNKEIMYRIGNLIMKNQLDSNLK